MKKQHREHCLEVIQEVLRQWDPIGLIDLDSQDSPANNEYDSYATGVLSALERGKNAKGIGMHLAQVRSDSIGLGSEHPSELEEEIGEKLVVWRAKGFRGRVDF